MMKKVFTIVVLSFTVLTPGGGQTIEQKITALINQMTVQEKILQLAQNPDAFSTATNTRLGIPGFVMADGPHGVRVGTATSFPVGIGLAATWDPDLARRVGTAMGEEFLGKGKSQALGPCLDLDRDPRNGRSPETGGEDPFLDAHITSNVVRGIQATGCIATVKHYNANHREDGRYTNDVMMFKRDMEERSGLTFRMAVQEGGAFSVMNAYNLINGEKCAENRTLLTDILRTDWGFPFYVVSDWGSIAHTDRAIKAGCDICMGADNYKNDLPGLISNGTVSIATVDSAVRRVLRTKFVSGLMSGMPMGNADNVGSAQHLALCLEAGRKSLVLLKNADGILPLSPSIGSIALIGPNAAVLRTDANGSSWVNPIAPVSPLQGLEARVGSGKVNYAQGCTVNSADTSGFAAARAAASAADVVVFVGGLDPDQEGEGHDRVGGSIALPGQQQNLINALAAVNPRIVAVLFSGGICGIEQCAANIKGLVYAFYPGEQAGTALAEVLFGDVNPSGKLPVTMPVDDAQLPVWNDDFTDGDHGGGYRWFDASALTPQFPFGFGLSYTTFAYSNIAVTPSAVAPGEPVYVSVDVTNSGAVAGDEIAELYLSHTDPGVDLPLKQLKAFQRVTLLPGQTSTVTFTLSADEFLYYDDVANQFDMFPGVYRVRVGGSSQSLPMDATFTVNTGPKKPDLVIPTVRVVPPFPAVGDTVTFFATVKNKSAQAVPAGTPVKVAFLVNGEEIATSVNTEVSIPAGGMVLLEANGGPAGDNFWHPGQAGAASVSAVADPDNAIDEIREDNNTTAEEVQVVPVRPVNLALRKSVTVSSVEGSGLGGDNAVDGAYGTRWSSKFSDPQWIEIDLGEPTHVDHVILRWEAAFGKEYYLLVSNDNTVFSAVFHDTAGNGGVDSIGVDTTGRYVKMLGMQRGTSYGYSLYEFEVYGSTVTDVPSAGTEIPVGFALEQNYPNPFNPTTTIQLELGEVVAPSGGEGPLGEIVRLAVYDVLGRQVAVLANSRYPAGKYSFTFDGNNLSSGVYFYRVTAGAHIAVRKMLLLR
jgi:beta-glucosidase